MIINFSIISQVFSPPLSRDCYGGERVFISRERDATWNQLTPVETLASFYRVSKSHHRYSSTTSAARVLFTFGLLQSAKTGSSALS